MKKPKGGWPTSYTTAISGPQKDKRGRLVCNCGGYWFPHRKGGGACDHSKTCMEHRMRRYD